MDGNLLSLTDFLKTGDISRMHKQCVPGLSGGEGPEDEATEPPILHVLSEMRILLCKEIPQIL